MFIWEQKDWPNFTYDASRYTEQAASFYKQAERTSGTIHGLLERYQTDVIVGLMVSEAINTSAIEGERLNRASVQSSIKAFAGLAPLNSRSYDPREEGIATLMVSVRQQWNQVLTEQILCNWQEMVVIESKFNPITRGQYRHHESPMQIVSGAIGKERVHYTAPPSKQVPSEMARFLRWYNASKPIDKDQQTTDMIRAGIAHAWFEKIHPFEDGNGRVGRAITDHAMSQALGYPTLVSMSTAIEQDRSAYYQALEQIGPEGLNLNGWLDYFIATAGKAQEISKQNIAFIIEKTRFYDKYTDQLNERQTKIVARIFAEGIKDFEGGLTNKKYQTITKCSHATATRDMSDLVKKGILIQQPGGGRSTHYALVKVKSTLPSEWR